MKKILFFNTTKLAVLSAMLLLAVFCTIGMSFTPAEEGENVGNPNDSTYVTGPRRGHEASTIPGCSGTKELDYFKATAVTMGNGTVSLADAVPLVDGNNIEDGGLITSTDQNPTSSAAEGASVSIEWNCNEKDKTTGTPENHKHTFKWKAEPSAGYNFKGWSTTNNEKDIFTKDNPLIHTMQMTSDTYGKENSYSKNNPYETKFYAFFEEQKVANITLGASSNGQYDYSYSDDLGNTISGTITNNNQEIKTGGTINLKATANTNYKFFGWYTNTDDPENYISYTKETGLSFQEDTTLYAKFIPENTAIWLIKETTKHYYDLSEAIDACGNETRTIVLISDGVVPAGDYTIPSGVTLLVPYDNAYITNTSSPTTVTADASPKDPSLYCKLTLEDGVNIEVQDGGSICVNAKILSGNTTAKNVCGRVTGGYGLIDMMSGSSITLSSDAKLYCWGYIIGEGTIEAKSGANVYEPFQLADFRGGTASSNFLSPSSCHKVFPYSQYYVQNIEVPITLYAGAEETLFSGFIASSKEINFEPKFVGSGGLFNITSGQLTKYYDKNEDRLVCTVEGNLEMNKLEISVGSMGTSISSENYVLPITNNLTININSGTTKVNAEAALLAGTRTYIAKGATLQLNKTTYIYDRDNWVLEQYVFGGSGNQSYFRPLHYSGSGGTSIKTKRTDNNLLDAVIDVNGTLKIEDYLYTTAGTGTEPNLGGADICSSEGTGIIQLTKGEGTGTITYQATQSGSDIAYSKIPITSAQLHNDEEMNPTEPYTQTSGAEAGDEFWYVGSLGKWVKNEFGPELDIVDADNTKKTLTINANGWASSGWPYTINGIPYEKNARQTDRTLVIPYTGTSGAPLPIAVLDKDGKPICRHIYKVPFVYTGTENMNAMNENSIVFVKSGMLSIEGTASAKEIYVAPGAELKVNGELDVEKLVLRTTPYEAAILTNNGTINGQVYYSRISPDAKQYYQFGLPLSCELANVKMSNTGKLGGSQPKYGTAWVLKSYNESKRAENGISSSGDNWEALKSTGTITASVGYEMFSNSNYYREFYFPVNLSEATNQVSVQYTEGTIGAEHNGWNIITSPLTSRANVPIIDPATDFKVCWLNEDGSYRQELPTVFPPAIPFSIQVSPKEGTLTFDANFTFAAQAPRKQSAAEALTETEWVHLDIFDAYGEGDETSLFVHPTRFEQTYKTGIDMAKQSLTASRAILYTTHAYGDMAFAGVADSLLENGIDLVVYSPSAQELTFSLRENKFLNRLEYLWLADNETGARTDLLMNDYTCRADAGTAKGRFVLNGRFKAPQIATGIGNTQTDYNIYAIGNNIAISGVEQGTPIYVFDAVGHMIYTTAATTAEVIVPAPCAGVYMLSVGGQTAKLVINK